MQEVINRPIFKMNLQNRCIASFSITDVMKIQRQAKGGPASQLGLVPHPPWRFILLQFVHCNKKTWGEKTPNSDGQTHLEQSMPMYFFNACASACAFTSRIYSEVSLKPSYRFYFWYLSCCFSRLYSAFLWNRNNWANYKTTTAKNSMP